MKKDRDKIDDLFRSKLYDFETDALPDDVWGKIESRLDKQSYLLPAATKWRWWSAAAAIALLVLGGMVYFIQTDEPVDPVLVQEIEQKTEDIKSILQEQPVSVIAEPASPVIAQVREAVKEDKPVLRSMISTVVAETSQPAVEDASEIMTEADDMKHEETDPAAKSETFRMEDSVAEMPVAVSSQGNEPEKKKEKVKRWSFGMGAGSITAGSDNAANMYAFRNTSMESPQLGFFNSLTDKSTEAPKTDIKHHQPVSIGLSASYMLAPRWYLMVGVNYSYLSSDWKTNGTYNATTEQRLHFVGLPVSLAYQIAEWNNFMWYASAGFQPELNVAGKMKVTQFVNDERKGVPEENNIRVKDLYWSVKAGTGISYPLWRYLNAFVEVGAGYHFDNGSSVQTIYSEKPFNVNLSFGLRLGF